MKKSDIYSTYIAAIYICHRSISASAIAVYIHPPSQYIFIRHRSIYSTNDDKNLCFLFTACSLHTTGDRERLRPCHPICSEGRRAK